MYSWRYRKLIIETSSLYIININIDDRNIRKSDLFTVTKYVRYSRYHLRSFDRFTVTNHVIYTTLPQRVLINYNTLFICRVENIPTWLRTILSPRYIICLITSIFNTPLIYTATDSVEFWRKHQKNWYTNTHL